MLRGSRPPERHQKMPLPSARNYCLHPSAANYSTHCNRITGTPPGSKTNSRNLHESDPGETHPGGRTLSVAPYPKCKKKQKARDALPLARKLPPGIKNPTALPQQHVNFLLLPPSLPQPVKQSCTHRLKHPHPHTPATKLQALTATDAQTLFPHHHPPTSPALPYLEKHLN